MPNIINFTYTKANGSVSERVISPVVFPSKMYEGVDISELEAEQQAFYVMEIDKAREAFANECLRIQDKFDVKNQYRRFDATKMTDIVTDCI